MALKKSEDPLGTTTPIYTWYLHVICIWIHYLDNNDRSMGLCINTGSKMCSCYLSCAPSKGGLVDLSTRLLANVTATTCSFCRACLSLREEVALGDLSTCWTGFLRTWSRYTDWIYTGLRSDHNEMWSGWSDYIPTPPFSLSRQRIQIVF